MRSLAKLLPLSVVNWIGVLNLPVNWMSSAAAAASALVLEIGYRSTNLEKLSIMTTIMLCPKSSAIHAQVLD